MRTVLLVLLVVPALCSAAPPQGFPQTISAWVKIGTTMDAPCTLVWREYENPVDIDGYVVATNGVAYPSVIIAYYPGAVDNSRWRLYAYTPALTELQQMGTMWATGFVPLVYRGSAATVSLMSGNFEVLDQAADMGDRLTCLLLGAFTGAFFWLFLTLLGEAALIVRRFARSV